MSDAASPFEPDGDARPGGGTPGDGDERPRHTSSHRRKDSPAAHRHRGRTLTLQALYEADQAGHDPSVSVERLIADEHVANDAATFARGLVAGIKRTRPQLDEYIRRSAPQWPVAQLAVVDRNILRIAIYEMLIENETPVRVAVNEAVELAKAFGSEATPRFVNGVLGALSAQRTE